MLFFPPLSKKNCSQDSKFTLLHFSAVILSHQVPPLPPAPPRPHIPAVSITRPSRPLTPLVLPTSSYDSAAACTNWFRPTLLECLIYIHPALLSSLVCFCLPEPACLLPGSTISSSPLLIHFLFFFPRSLKEVGGSVITSPTLASVAKLWRRLCCRKWEMHGETR